MSLKSRNEKPPAGDVLGGRWLFFCEFARRLLQKRLDCSVAASCDTRQGRRVTAEDYRVVCSPGDCQTGGERLSVRVGGRVGNKYQFQAGLSQLNSPSAALQNEYL